MVLTCSKSFFPWTEHLSYEADEFNTEKHKNNFCRKNFHLLKAKIAASLSYQNLEFLSGSYYPLEQKANAEKPTAWFDWRQRTAWAAGKNRNEIRLNTYRKRRKKRFDARSSGSMTEHVLSISPSNAVAVHTPLYIYMNSPRLLCL